MNKQNEVINKFYEILAKHLNEGKEAKSTHYNYRELQETLNKYFK